MAPGLEEAGLGAEPLTPERLAPVADSRQPDAVVLDMRDLPPTAFTLLLDEFSERRVVVVCALEAEQLDRIRVGLAVDDFLVLPAPARELGRRIERALWRVHGIDSENLVTVGDLEIDLSNYRVTVAGDPVVLTFKEFELLRFMAMNSGRVFTREQLLNRVWGYDYFGGARTVDVHVRRIRSKIEVHDTVNIETVRNVGYRLVSTPPPAGRLTGQRP